MKKHYFQDDYDWATLNLLCSVIWNEFIVILKPNIMFYSE